MHLFQKYTVHPVGQGFFYSGQIRLNEGEPFVLVYDCGTANKGALCQRAIHKFDEEVQHRDIDLLVISHFDFDHISQLKALLPRGRKVKKLVAPFLEEIEKLAVVFCLARELYRRRPHLASTDKELDPNDLLDLVDDTVGWLRRNGSWDDGSNAYFVAGGGEEPPGGDDAINVPSNPEGDRLIFDFENKYGAPAPLSGTGIWKISHRNPGRVRTETGTAVVDLIFYRASIDAGMEQYLRQAEQYFVDHPKEKDKIRNLLNVDEQASNKVVGMKALLEPMHQAAKKNIQDISFRESDFCNVFAMPMLHATNQAIVQLINEKCERLVLDGGWDDLSEWLQRIFPELIPILKYRMVTGSTVSRLLTVYPNALLTADIPLYRDEEVTTFLNHYRQHWMRFHLFQIPHHGSPKNSSVLLYQNLPSGTVAFVNFGPNRHGHPNQIVLDLVDRLSPGKFLLKRVDGQKQSAYRHGVQWYCYSPSTDIPIQVLPRLRLKCK